MSRRSCVRAAAGDERAAVAVGTGARPAVGRVRRDQRRHARRATPRPRRVRAARSGTWVTDSCSIRSVATITRSFGAHSSVRASTHRSSTGSSNGAPVRRPPSLRMRISWPPSGRSSARPSVADQVDTERLEGACASRDRRPGPGRVAELGEVAAHTRPGTGRAARARARAARRTPPRRTTSASAWARRASATRRFATANRASAVRLACCLPPACSRARRRRHRSSARRSIAGVTRALVDPRSLRSDRHGSRRVTGRGWRHPGGPAPVGTLAACGSRSAPTTRVSRSSST